ncbi:MAG: glycosyltransferase family 2 protein [Spongiibacteraceae bacterium]
MNAQPSFIPRVSIVVTAYNGRAWIDRALRSALQQTHANIEVIVVDDASTDGTWDYVQQHYGGNVRLLRNETNRGPSASRNRAIDAASGDWFMQLDGDDWIAPNRAEHLLQLAATTRAAIVADDQLLVMDGTDAPIGTNFIANGLARRRYEALSIEQFVRRDLGYLKPMIQLSLLRTSGIRYPEHIRYGEDFVFLYSLLLYGATFSISPELLYFMRRGNTGSLTTQRDPLFQQVIATTETLLSEAQAHNQTQIVAALQARIKQLQTLQRGERIIGQLRARRPFAVLDVGPLVGKIRHRIAAQIRLALLLRHEGQAIQRRLASA